MDGLWWWVLLYGSYKHAGWKGRRSLMRVVFRKGSTALTASSCWDCAGVILWTLYVTLRTAGAHKWKKSCCKFWGRQAKNSRGKTQEAERASSLQMILSQSFHLSKAREGLCINKQTLWLPRSMQVLTINLPKSLSARNQLSSSSSHISTANTDSIAKHSSKETTRISFNIAKYMEDNLQNIPQSVFSFSLPSPFSVVCQVKVMLSHSKLETWKTDNLSLNNSNWHKHQHHHHHKESNNTVMQMQHSDWL